MNRYLPPQIEHWQGRDDGPLAKRMHQCIQLLDLRIDAIPADAVILIGFACDEGIKRNQGRLGASEGPYTFRKILSSMPAPKKTVVDAGTIFCQDGNLEESQLELAGAIKSIIQSGSMPFVIGGGHELAWGHFQGIAQCGLAEKINLLNIDAHYDLRLLTENKGNSGTSFTQIAEHQQQNHLSFRYACIGNQFFSNTTDLHQRAKDLGVVVVSAEDVQHGHTAELDKILTSNAPLYLSICLDVFASHCAPGVSAPQPLGLLSRDIIPLIRKIASTGKLAAFDIAELNPIYDLDHHTARLASALFLEILHSLQ